MKKTICILLAFLLAVGASFPALAAEEQSADAFYADVPETLWSFQQIRELYDRGILPQEENFRPREVCTRLDFVQALYRLHLDLGGAEETYTETVFTDVPEGSRGYEAVMWAYNASVTSGVSKTLFGPDQPVTREQCACFIIHYCSAKEIPLEKMTEAKLFSDSATVSSYARSPLLACRMAGVFSGYPDGSIHPRQPAARQEAAAMVCGLRRSALGGAEGKELISTEENAYLDLFQELRRTYDYKRPIPESGKTSVDWFKDAVFIGDSVSVRLELYCGATKALGKAKFLCAGSLSATNALWEVSSDSVHPSYNGVKMKVEDGVKACGAKNVYIMLGMNNLGYYGIEKAAQDMVTLIRNIRAKSPQVNIIIQSVTPVTSTSTVGISNAQINAYNEKMKELCVQNRWYYLDVAPRFMDGAGYLKTEYCSDPYGMGMHFTSAGAQVWIDYLKTHVPEPLK